MQYRLIKSEPYKYSWDDFIDAGKTNRDGIRNFQARNNLRLMEKGDLCFWYHSNEGKEIIGIAKVSKEAFPDPTAKEGDRVAVEVMPEGPLSKPVTLEMIKDDTMLQDMVLLKQQRLSVSPVTKSQFDRILSISER